MSCFKECFISLLIVIFSFYVGNAQAPIQLRSTLGVGGSSKTVTSQGGYYFVQQSIGQSSIIGLTQTSDYLLRQGFIQPPVSSSQSLSTQILQAEIYPNPFSESITIFFSEGISDNLYITLYDLFGKSLCSSRYEATQELTLNFDNLTSGLYVIKINTSKKHLIAKLIKE